MPETTFYPRHIERHLTETLEDSPVVLIHGPRQCGKTTLAQAVYAPEILKQDKDPTTQADITTDKQNTIKKYFNFEDNAVYRSAKDDPVGFVSRLPERVILDEVQRIPEIFSILKMEVDRKRIPGRFVLTGSANVLLVPKLSDSLAGRMQVVRLHPLAQCELESESLPGFLDAVFENRFKTRRTERLGKRLCERIVAGGYPAALPLPSGRRRTSWYRNYIEAHLQKDMRDLAQIRMLDVLPRLLTLATAQTAGLFNLSNLASPFQVSRPTIGNYIKLLETVFLIERVPPWHSNRRSRLVKTPKIHIGDTGLACALLGVDASGLEEDRPLLGQLLETFVFQELRRQASWHDDYMSFYHYRDRDGAEVDIVIERGTRAVAGVEIKASSTVTKKDFRGLRRLREAAGERFKAGVVLYDGEICASFGGGLHAVPIRFLWETT